MMTPALLTSSLMALALAQAGPSAPRDLEEPPPAASPQEQAVWRRAYDTDNRIITVRTSATQLQLRAKVALAELERLARAGRLPAAEARHLRHELEEAWTANAALMRAQWPVDPTRACRQDHLLYDSALQDAPGPRRTYDVGAARASLEECLGRADRVLAKASAANRELEEEVGAAEKAIAGAAREKEPAP
ncbi:MAG: hypothetical protein QM704_14025 [Anaeromyxobacteraceae bacterium]